MSAIPKFKPTRNAAWLDAVRDVGYCCRCAMVCRPQASHRNEGKGMGQKVSDHLTAALCPDCHFAIDNGKAMNRDERRAAWDKAFVATVAELQRQGRIAQINVSFLTAAPKTAEWNRQFVELIDRMVQQRLLTLSPKD